MQRSAVHDVLRSGGRPLSEAVRADMEARLGAGFSDVRIHDDTAAKASAAEMGARAYTSGSHVVIGDGGADGHTLAHELTHVIQQRSGPVAGTDNGAGLAVSDPSDRFERDAEANARRAMSARPAASERAEPAAWATTLGTPVQRFTDDARTSELTGTGPYFESQSTGSELISDRGKLSQHSVDHLGIEQHAGGQDRRLRLSDDGTVAIHDIPGREPKEFYATQAVLDASNAALTEGGSEYRLTATAAQIFVPFENKVRRMLRIKPVRAAEQQTAAASEFADLVRHKCIDVARKVAGSYHLRVIRNGENGNEYDVWSGNAPDTMAKRLAPHPDGPDAADPDLAARYGKQLRNSPREMDDAAAALGVNQFARPNVGEAFATASIGEGAKLDFASPRATDTDPAEHTGDIWNFHFAGVAAKSMDGRDYITLENYNRSYNSAPAMKRLCADLEKEFTRKTRIACLRPMGKRIPEGETGEKIMKMLERLVGVWAWDARKRAEAEYKRLTEAQSDWNRKWYFRMYGSGQGQTFHEQQYDNGEGDFVNPVTLRVGAQPRDPEGDHAANAT